MDDKEQVEEKESTYQEVLIGIHKKLCDLGITHNFSVCEEDRFLRLEMSFQAQGKRPSLPMAAAMTAGVNTCR